MNADALCEVVLTLASFAVAWHLMRGPHALPGAAIGIGVVGFAALLGIPDYLGVTLAKGPHQFASLVAAGAGLPLLGIAICWPDSMLATQRSAAGYFAVMAGGMAVLIGGLLGIWQWSLVAPAVAIVLMAVGGARSGRPLLILAVSVLAATFVLSAAGWTMAPLGAVQQLHLLMALGWTLLAIDARMKVQASA